MKDKPFKDFIINIFMSFYSKIKKLTPSSRDLLGAISIAVEALIIVGIVAYLLYTLESMYFSLDNLNNFADTAILNSLVTIALVEVYLGAKTYFDVGGKQSMAYIIDAALSFVIREIIIQIVSKNYTAELILSFGILTLILVVSKRYVA